MIRLSLSSAILYIGFVSCSFAHPIIDDTDKNDDELNVRITQENAAANAAKPTTENLAASTDTKTTKDATKETAKEKEAPKEPPIDTKYSWAGDIIKFHADFPKMKSDTVTLCAPSDSKFSIANEDEKTHVLSGVFLEVGSQSEGCKNQVKPNTTYTMDKAAVEPAPHSRSGWTFGALMLPFKYQLSDKSFSSALTIGPYLGYGTSSNWGKFWGGTSTMLVVSAGLVNNISVPVAKTADSKESNPTVNRSGFTTAIGLIFAVNKGSGLQIGVFVGQDRLGHNAAAPYQYEGKTWISGMIGYKFY